MIGIIVCGHGNFASGICSSLKLIAGLPKYYAAVDFVDGHSTDDLKDNLMKARMQLEECTELLCLTDVLGGSPFKVSAEIASMYKDKKMVVVSGTNLGMLIEASMAASYTDDADVLADQIVTAGKDNVIKFVQIDMEEENEDFSDGI